MGYKGKCWKVIEQLNILPQRAEARDASGAALPDIVRVLPPVLVEQRPPTSAAPRSPGGATSTVYPADGIGALADAPAESVPCC